MTKPNCIGKTPLEQQKHEKYLKRAIDKYGSEKFDYSDTFFSGSLKEVSIGCNTCGHTFQTNAYMHTRKSGLGGCDTCRNTKREQNEAKAIKSIGSKEKSRALRRMILKHGVAFNYRSAKAHEGKDVKLEAECLSCSSVFSVLAKEHYRNPNCYCCGLNRKKIIESKKHKDNLARAIDKHGDRYDFSKAFMKSSTAKVAVTCNTCSETTKQVVSNIIHNSDGCRNCYYNKNKTDVDDFLRRANEKHGSKYTYSTAKFDSLNTVLPIECPEHGVFRQLARDHLKHGCQECGKSLGGWSRARFVKLCKKNGNSMLYVIKCKSSGESFYKIGITSNDLNTRFKYSKYLPYDYESLYEITAQPDFIYDLEVRLHNLIAGYSYQPALEFHGHTECFTTIKPIEQLLKRLTSTEQLQLIA